MKRSNSTSCIYCGRQATTRDHVPPKLLLERPLPSTIRTVPSCFGCNQGVSLDEQYFLVLLGHISISPTITSKVSEGGVIDRTLMRSPALEERLIQAFEVDNEEGQILIRPENDRVTRVIRKIGVGLFYARYGRIPEFCEIGPVGIYPYQLRDDRPLPYFIATFTERFRAKKWRVIQSDVFSYIFVRDPKSIGKMLCIMDIHQTLWGVVHFLIPKSFGRKGNQQLRLYPE